jgi:hypothetical protein
VENSHITYNAELHWRLAAQWNKYKWHEFVDLEGTEQSKLVATYESSLQMQAVITTDANRMAKRKQGKRGSGGR